MAADPHLAAARYILRQSLTELREAISGLSAEALNWRPAGEETNSIAVLTTHALQSTRSWLSIAVGAPLPERDRDSEFTVSAMAGPALLAFLDEMSVDCTGLLDSPGEIDWSALRQTHQRPAPDAQQAPAAFALVHAIEHLREHLGQVTLTRQVWEHQR